MGCSQIWLACSCSQEILDGVTNIDLVVNLKIREDVLMAKCLGRRICSECSGNFNVASINVKGENGNPGISMAPLLPPPHCMSKLITRSDDTEAVVKERLRVYNEKVLFNSFTMLFMKRKDICEFFNDFCLEFLSLN